MGKGSPPKAPDPIATANAQTKSNKETAVAQTGLNMVGQKTPFGSLEYSQVGKWDDGTPKFEATQSLSPGQMQLYETGMQANQNLANVGLEQSQKIGNILSDPVTSKGLPQGGSAGGISTPSYSLYGATPELKTSIAGSDGYSADRQRVEDALFSRLNPQIEKDRTGLETRLANQGIRLGSSAYDRAMGEFGQNVNDARTSAILNAGQEQNRLQQLELNAGNFANQAAQQGFMNKNLVTDQGNQIGDRNFANQRTMFDLANAERANALNEKLGLRNQALNENIGLATGSQITPPSFQPTPQTGVAGTDIAGITQADYANRMNAYNQQQQGFNQMMGGLFSAGASLMPLFMPSDRRLKTDIKKIGKTDDNQPIYSYRYKAGGPTQIGLMAQDVKKKRPEAVHKMGEFFAVDYKKALEKS